MRKRLQWLRDWLSIGGECLRRNGNAVSIIGGFVLFISWFLDKNIAEGFGEEKIRFERLQSDYNLLDRHITISGNLDDTYFHILGQTPTPPFDKGKDKDKYREIIKTQADAFAYQNRFAAMEYIQPLAVALSDSWFGPKYVSELDLEPDSEPKCETYKLISDVTAKARNAWTELKGPKDERKKQFSDYMKSANEAIDLATGKGAANPEAKDRAIAAAQCLAQFIKHKIEPQFAETSESNSPGKNIDDILGITKVKIRYLGNSQKMYIRLSYSLYAFGTVLVLFGQFVERFRRPGLPEAVAAGVAAAVTPSVVNAALPAKSDSAKIANLIQCVVADDVRGNLTREVRRAGSAAVSAAAIAAVDPLRVKSALVTGGAFPGPLAPPIDNAIDLAFQELVPLAVTTAVAGSFR